jgi:hypothetical protein
MAGANERCYAASNASGARYVAYRTTSLQIASAAAQFRTTDDDSTKAHVLQAQNAFSILHREWLTPAHRARHQPHLTG